MMRDSFKVSKDNISKVEEYLRAGTLEKGAVSVSIATMAEDLGISGATIHRAIAVLRARGLVTAVPSRSPGLPQTITYLPAGRDISNDVAIKAKLRSAIAELEVELDKMAEANRALHEEVATYREQNARIESRAELEDGRVMLLIRPSGSVSEPKM